MLAWNDISAEGRRQKGGAPLLCQAAAPSSLDYSGMEPPGLLLPPAAVSLVPALTLLHVSSPVSLNSCRSIGTGRSATGSAGDPQPPHAEDDTRILRTINSWRKGETVTEESVPLSGRSGADGPFLRASSSSSSEEASLPFPSPFAHSSPVTVIVAGSKVYEASPQGEGDSGGKSVQLTRASDQQFSSSSSCSISTAAEPSALTVSSSSSSRSVVEQKGHTEAQVPAVKFKKIRFADEVAS